MIAATVRQRRSDELSGENLEELEDEKLENTGITFLVAESGEGNPSTQTRGIDGETP